VVIVLVLLLDEVIQEVAIFFTNALSQRQGTIGSRFTTAPAPICEKNPDPISFYEENKTQYTPSSLP
jgi:hypothetical protein